MTKGKGSLDGYDLFGRIADELGCWYFAVCTFVGVIVVLAYDKIGILFCCIRPGIVQYTCLGGVFTSHTVCWGIPHVHAGVQLIIVHVSLLIWRSISETPRKCNIQMDQTTFCVASLPPAFRFGLRCVD